MKKIITLCLSLCMTTALAAPAYALEYSIAAPDDYDFGKDTSIEVIHTVDGGAMKNADMSKNAALEYGQHGILTNAIAPGAILTPMVAEAFKQVNPADPKGAEAQYASRNPTRRLGARPTWGIWWRFC